MEATHLVADAGADEPAERLSPSRRKSPSSEKASPAESPVLPSTIVPTLRGPGADAAEVAVELHPRPRRARPGAQARQGVACSHLIEYAATQGARYARSDASGPSARWVLGTGAFRRRVRTH